MERSTGLTELGSPVDESGRPRRRWLQFRLRTLLIAVLVLSLPLSWFAVRMERARRQREAVEAIRRLGGDVTYEPIEPSVPQWMRGLLGDDFFIDVVEAYCSKDFGDEEAMYLRGLTNLELLWLVDTQVSNAGLEHLKRLTDLEELILAKTHITDAGLEHLKGLTGLQILWLNDTQVTDVGLEHLRGLSNLECLQLYGTKVSDGGLEHLKGLTKLKELWLDSTQATPEQVKKLQEALPNCSIEYWPLPFYLYHGFPSERGNFP